MVTSPFTAIFICTVLGVSIDRALRYRTSRATRSAIAKTPVDKYAKDRVNKIAENGGVIDFTPTAKTEGTWIIFFVPSFVLYFSTRKSTGTPTRDLGFGREVAFCFGSALLGNFALFCFILSSGSW